MPKAHLPKVDCCAWRETLMARKKKEARSRKKPRNVMTTCCSGKTLTCDEISKITAEPSTPTVCGGKVKKRKVRLVKRQLECDFSKLFTKIKPTISERERYLDVKHIMCVLEDEDLIRIKAIQKIREKLEKSEDLGGNDMKADPYRNAKRQCRSIASQKTEATCKDNQEKNSDTVRGKTGKQDAKNRNSDKKIKTPTGKSTLGNIECTSICSFDSVVDLTGFHLTKDDVEEIEKDREHLKQQKPQKRNEANKDKEIVDEAACEAVDEAPSEAADEAPSEAAEE